MTITFTVTVDRNATIRAHQPEGISHVQAHEAEHVQQMLKYIKADLDSIQSTCGGYSPPPATREKDNCESSLRDAAKAAAQQGASDFGAADDKADAEYKKTNPNATPRQIYDNNPFEQDAEQVANAADAKKAGK